MYRLFQRQAIRTTAQVFASEGYCCIIDGSMLSAYCFALFHKNRGNINEECYENFIIAFEAVKFNPPNHTIFLDVSPKVARDRCYRRGNSEAKIIQLEFFEQLNNTYNQLLSDKDLVPNLTIIDWNPDRNPEERLSCMISVFDNNSKK